jgi:hypothetical protein
MPVLESTGYREQRPERRLEAKNIEQQDAEQTLVLPTDMLGRVVKENAKYLHSLEG